MTDLKNIALLEYDGTQEAVLNPTHEGLDMKLPERAIFGFLGDEIDKYAEEKGLEPVGFFETITKIFPIYVDDVNGTPVALSQAPLGAPAAVSQLDWMIGYGVKKIVAAGSCGALVELPENEFLVPVRALRDEGTSFHYLPASRFVDTDPDIRKAIEETFAAEGIAFKECTTWTTDGFFRETVKKVSDRKAEGCTCVDMECSAMAACAKFRGAGFAQILFTADSLANVSEYDSRDFGKDSLRPALDLCLKIAERM